jgi:hypothetical protein
LAGLLGSAPAKDEKAERFLAADVADKFISDKAPRFLQSEKSWSRYRDVLRFYGERFSSLDGLRIQGLRARAALMFVSGTCIYSRSHEKRIAVIGDWLRLYGSGDVGAASEAKAGLYLLRARDFLDSGEFERASEDVEAFVGRVGSGELKSARRLPDLFLEALPHLVAGLGPTKVLDWLMRIDQPWLVEDTRRQVGFHQNVARLLLSEQGGPGGAKKARQEQMELLRVPSELRKTLEASVRQVYKLKKEMGAEW